MEKTTILIADDHTLVRETWSFILSTNPQFEVLAECGSGEEAVELVRNLRPQIIIMDINLPGINGIEATQQILKCAPGSRILGVSLHTQPTYARAMMQKGAMGYVTKNSSREEMFEAIQELCCGRKYICREIKNILSDQMINGDNLANPLHTLSQREIEIIGLIKKGLSSREMADTLSVSIKTIEVHRYNILRKLDIRNSAALVNFINNSPLELEN